jgi:hypothetical protein
MSKMLKLSFIMALIFALGVPKALGENFERKSKPMPASAVFPVADGQVVPPKVSTGYPTTGIKYRTTSYDISPQAGTIIQLDSIGSTWYDYQKNGSMGRMIAVSPSGHREIAFMNVQGGPFPDNPRYITYNCKSPEGVWCCDTTNVDGGSGINPGFCNNDVMHDGREVVIYHRHFDYWYVTLAMGDTGLLCSSGNDFDIKYDLPDSLGGEYGGMWPKMGIIHDAMVDTDYIHVVMNGGGPEPANRLLGYVRCRLITSDTLLCDTPTGQPGVTSPVKLLPNDKLIPNKMVAYFGEVEAPGVPPGEYPNTISVIAVTSPVSRKVAIVFTNKRQSGTTQVNNDLFYFESTNNGHEWFPQYGGTWPPTLANGMLHNVTNYQTTDMERAYTDVAACYDYNDNLHIVWNAHWYDSTAGLVSNDANLYHWSEAGGISRITSAYWGGTAPGAWNRNISKMSISAMDPIYHSGSDPDSVYLYCIWTQFDPGDISANGYSNGDIYGSVSVNGGASWGYAYNLTNTKTPGCPPGDCHSEHWASLSKNLYDGNLHIQYISDRDAGGSTWGEGQWTENPVMYLELQAFRYDSIPFAPVVNYDAGDGPHSVFCADLDGDVDLDLAVANWNSDKVSILKNNGDGTFQTKVDYGVAGWPRSVFCADLDGDLDLDLAVANFYNDNVSILKNNGDGTFQTKVDYGAGDGPSSIFCADLDGDDDLDLAVANQYSDNVFILKNNGDGTFQAKVDYGVGDYPFSVFCADLDGDTDLDLAVANYGSDNVSILKNNGDGTYQTAVNYEAGYDPWSVFCADLDGDTDLDLAVADASSDNVSILKNNGNGTFQTKVGYGVGDYPFSVFCADLDGDTDLDLSAANWNSDNVSILKNNGNGTFQSAVNYGAGNEPWSVFCADLDGDSDLDLTVANYVSDNVSILKNLTQVPANQPPWAFSLISPPDQDTIFGSVTFQWHIPYDPNFGDQMRYDLYISTSPGFEPPYTIVNSNLAVSKFVTAMDSGAYYWKVKAKDNWGAETWSTETWSFVALPTSVPETLWIVAYSPVDLIVTDPLGDSIGLEFNTIQDATYEDTVDWNEDGDSDDLVTIPHPYVGEYQIRVIREDGVPDTATYDLGIRIDGSDMDLLADDDTVPPADGSSNYGYNCLPHLKGDVNCDDVTNSADIVFLINYLFKSGPAPDPLELGDVNCDEVVNSADVVYLINYLFKGGPPPCS